MAKMRFILVSMGAALALQACETMGATAAGGPNDTIPTPSGEPMRVTVLEGVTIKNGTEPLQVTAQFTEWRPVGSECIRIDNWPATIQVRKDDDAFIDAMSVLVEGGEIKSGPTYTPDTGRRSAGEFVDANSHLSEFIGVRFNDREAPIGVATFTVEPSFRPMNDPQKPPRVTLRARTDYARITGQPTLIAGVVDLLDASDAAGGRRCLGDRP